MKEKTALEKEALRADPVYPQHIPEAQGDLADRANIEVDQEIQAAIFKVRQNLKAQIEEEEAAQDSN